MASPLRVSDDDRERVAREIREHFASGRLTEEELDERVAATYAARTEADLEAIRADLPRLPATAAELRAAHLERRAELRRQLFQHAGGALAPFGICTVVWLASGASGFFWPIWIALFALIPLIRNGWRLYGPAPELDQVERELARRQRRGPPVPRQRHRGRRRL